MPSFGSYTTPYPTGFYVAHRLFEGRLFKPGGEWGDVLDGPIATCEDCAYALKEALKEELAEGMIPARYRLRVWRIEPGKPAEDCTDWAIGVLRDSYEEHYADGYGWPA